MTAPKKATQPVEKFDYSSLSAEEVETTTVRVTNVEKTPFIAWYRESKETGKGKKFGPIPATERNRVDSLLRKAAQQFPNGGISIGYRETGNGMLMVTFTATDKRKFTKPRKPVKPRKRRENESVKDYNARVEKYNTALRAWERANV